MINGTQNTMLEFLITHSDESPTIRSLSRQLKKPYALIHRNVADLLKKGVIEKVVVPPANLLKIHELISKDILTAIENNIKSKFFKENSWAKVMFEDLLSYASQTFFILLIFGSYSKGKQTKKSDLDLLLIVPKKEDTKEIEAAMAKTYTKTKKTIVVVTAEDFKEMIKNPKEFNVGNEAKKHHIILYGVEQYYELIK